MGKVLLLLFFMTISLFAKVLDVGVILENESSHSQVMLDILNDELSKNFAGTGLEPKVTTKLYLSNQTLQESLNKMNSNSKIDAVFILTSTPVEKISNVNSNKFYSIPLGLGSKSYILPENVNYIYTDINLNNLLKPFKDMKDAKEIDVLISNVDSATLKAIENKTNIPNVKVNVLAANMGNLSRSIQRKNPSFLIDFNEHLKPYAYSGLNLNRELVKRLRASSLNYVFYKTKSNTGKIVEVIPPQVDIYFNNHIATQIDVFPNLIFLQGLSEVNITNETKTSKLTLKGAVERALTANPDLLQVQQNVVSNFYNVKVTGSKLLPQLTANMGYSALDDRAPSFKQGTPANTVNSYLQLSQVIFDDQINANMYIEKLALDSSRKQLEQQKLNTIYYVASTYVNILQLQAQLAIQMSNYGLSQETLHISKINYQVGAGGLQDVYRLQSEVASSLSNIANYKGQIRSQEIYLNNLLNVPKDTKYTYETLEEIAPYFILSERLSKNFTFGSDISQKIENFLVRGAIENSNSLQQLDNSIKEKEREKTANDRVRYLPTVNAFGNYYKNNIVTPWGKNSNREYPAEYWEAGVNVSLPLISGGEIYYNGKMIDSEIKALEYNKISSVNDLAKEVLQTYTQVLTYYVQTYTTKISADVAVKSLAIEKNLYAEGNTTLTDFLSAQNNTLTQQLDYIIENFNLINSTLKLENLYGKSSITMGEAERKSLLLKLQNELEN